MSNPRPALARWGQRAQLWSWGAFQILRYGRPQTVFAHYGGIGDALMLARVLREWRKREKQRAKIWTVTEFPELFAHNPDCDHALRFSSKTERMLQRIGAPLQWLHYSRRDEATDCDRPPPGHLIASMCRLARITGEIELKPHLVLTPEELMRGRQTNPPICIQSTARGARFPIPNKEWGPDRFATVATALTAQGQRVVQIGSRHDPALPGAEDLRGKTTLRETAALLASSRLFVGLVGGLMHLARAVDCPAVIVYGGRESPEQSGYSANHNVVNQPACSPCWLASRCEHELSCLRNITPAEVLAEIERALSASRPSVLPFDCATIT